jgi:ABC-type transporter Mla MlaB component
MEAIQNGLYSNDSAFEEQKRSFKGYFKLNKSGSKVTLKLKGDFNNTNINCVNSSMKMINSLCHRHFELDLSEVENITMQAMALLIINLKMLEESGVHTKATGLDRGKLKLASELGMHFITRTE